MAQSSTNGAALLWTSKRGRWRLIETPDVPSDPTITRRHVVIERADPGTDTLGGTRWRYVENLPEAVLTELLRDVQAHYGPLTADEAGPRQCEPQDDWQGQSVMQDAAVLHDAAS